MFEGIMSALLSVYDENLNIKEDTVNKMVEYQLKNGIAGFYVGGNTGECTVLPNRIRKEMVEATIRANKGRGKIIVHVGAGHLDDVYDLIDHANKCNIDAIASLPPSLTSYYEMDEIIEYYRLIAKRSKHPVLAYVTPVLKGDLIEFAKEIMQIDNIIGLKVSISDYSSFVRLKELCNGKINILNGPDESMLAGLACGADGAIGTSYNLLPRLSTYIYNSFRACKMKEALEAQRQLTNVIFVLIDNNISYWKAALSLLCGFDMGYTIQPCIMPNKKDLEVLREKLEKVGYFNLI